MCIKTQTAVLVTQVSVSWVTYRELPAGEDNYKVNFQEEQNKNIIKMVVSVGEREREREKERERERKREHRPQQRASMVATDSKRGRRDTHTQRVTQTDKHRQKDTHRGR